MSSNTVTRLSVEIAGSEISFETGRIAKQAGGAVVVRQGDTMVLATATAGNLRDTDFLPLTVDVEERMYAAGKIPGSFFKREGRAGEKGTLTARMIDRPIRPLLPKSWRYETQIVAMPLSVDHVHPYDILAMNGASAALMISDIPLATPVGAVRIGKIDGNFVVNPSEADFAGPSPVGVLTIARGVVQNDIERIETACQGVSGRLVEGAWARDRDFLRGLPRLLQIAAGARPAGEWSEPREGVHMRQAGDVLRPVDGMELNSLIGLRVHPLLEHGALKLRFHELAPVVKARLNEFGQKLFRGTCGCAHGSVIPRGFRQSRRGVVPRP